MLTVDELKRTYKGSALGLLWILLKPLLLITLYATLFGFIFQSRAGPQQTSTQYLLVLLSGLIPWQMFSESVTAATGSIVSNVALVTKILFPFEILPVSKVLGTMLTGLISFILLVAVLVSLHQVGWTLLLLPFLLVAQLLFTVGLTWCLSAFNVAVRDTNQVLPLAITVWMFLSPVVYTFEMVPPTLASVFWYNPMSYFLEGYRTILLMNQPPSFQVWVVVSSLAGSVFLGGWLVFSRMRDLIADNI